VATAFRGLVGPSIPKDIVPSLEPSLSRSVVTAVRIAIVVLLVSACGADLTPSPTAPVAASPTVRPSASPAPSPSVSPSATPLPEHCPGTDRTPGKPPGPSISERSENWAGYVVYDAKVAITCVEGSWIQPTVTCPSTGVQNVAIWVGIDGVKSGAGVNAGTDLLQIGTQAGCDAGQKSAFAWYEVIPLDPLSVGIQGVTIAPGDRVRAMVSFARDVFTLLLVDETSGESFSVAKTLAHARRQTAEWIVEAPMIGCPADCVIAQLPRFGKVSFSEAFASTATQRGAIDDDAWTHGTTELVRGGIVRAAVTKLGAEGTSFGIVWRHR
jgi:hypothetical protein